GLRRCPIALEPTRAGLRRCPIPLQPTRAGLRRCLIPLQPTRAGLHAMLGVEPPLGHAIMPSIARREHVAESSQAPLRSAASPTGRRRAARVATPARPGRTLDSSIAGRASPQAAGAASAPFGPGAPPAL